MSVMTTDRELGTLNALARALSHSIDVRQVLHAALDTVADLLALDTGWVWLLDASGAARLAASRNLPPGLVARPELMEGPCYCLNTYRAGDLRGAANVNVVWCSRLDQLVEGANGLQVHASIPLYVDDRKLGILNVASRDWRELSRDELDLLYTIGALVSLAVERTRLAAAEERNRLAREIHDTLAQSLAAISMQLETADALAEPARDPRLTETIRRALGLTRSTLAEARRSVMNLRTDPLAGATLGEALRALTSDALIIDVQVDDGSPFPSAVAIGLYEIAREALANVTRYAGVREARVHVSRSGSAVHLRVEDHGIGFDVHTVPIGRFGLVGMGERARLLGGTMHIESAPGAGTTVTVDVSLDR